MKGAGLEPVVTSVRQLLAVVIAVLSIAGAGYLLSHKLSNPDHFVYYRYPVPGQFQGSCGHFPTGITPGIAMRCNPPTRAAWQIPAAILLATLGLGAVGVVGSGTGRAAAQAIPCLGARPPA